jgi:hypothetical protein
MKIENDLFNKEHFLLQVMANRTINVDKTKTICAVLSICGQKESSRSYITSWYSEGLNKELYVHIYISETLTNSKEELLHLLDEKLFLCKTEDDLILLNGIKI